MSIAVKIGMFLVRTAISIALDTRVRTLALDAVLQAEKVNLTGPEKLKQAVTIVTKSHAAKNLPGILKTLAVERAVEELHKRAGIK
jgi:hypothetical protein